MKKLAKKGIRPGFGWMPHLPDHRDHLYAAQMAKLGPLPAKVDLRKRCRRFTTREKSALAPLMRSRRPSSSIARNKNCPTLFHHASSFIITSEASSAACRSITAHRFATRDKERRQTRRLS